MYERDVAQALSQNMNYSQNFNGQSAKAPRGAPIEDAKNGLTNDLDTLANLVDALEKRLCTVLLPTPPGPETASLGSVRAACSPLAENLEATRQSVNLVVLRVRSMLDRIEL